LLTLIYSNFVSKLYFSGEHIVNIYVSAPGWFRKYRCTTALVIVIAIIIMNLCCRIPTMMPLLTPKRAIKAVFIISALGFVLVDISILLRDDDASTTTGDALDARDQLLRSSAFHNLSGGNYVQRERLRLLRQVAIMHRRNQTNASHLVSELPRVFHMSGNRSEIRAAVLEANRQQRISNLDMFDLVASDSAVVIVVQVHNRSEYLRHLVSSLRKAVDIEQTLLVFSHDFYSDELNDIVASVDFCPVSCIVLLLVLLLN